MAEPKKFSEVITEKMLGNSPLPRVTVSVSAKINTGNYESVDVFCSASDNLLPGCSLKELGEGLYNECREILEPQIKRIKTKRGNDNGE